jgi:hypothetical protein
MPSPGPVINDSLKQIMDVASRMGLFLPNPTEIQPMENSGYKPDAISNKTFITPSLNPQQEKQLSLYNMEQGQKAWERQNKITGGIAAGFSLINQLVPEQKTKTPVVRPLQSYNPTPYGNGSQAIAKYGAKLKANMGMSLFTEDPEKPAKKTYQTQAEVDAANLFAKEFSKRHNTINPGEAYVAKKPGDPVVQFTDLATGKPYDGRYSKMPASMIKHSVPDWVTKLEWNKEWNQPYYLDGNDMIYVDQRFFNSDRFLTSKADQQKIFDQKNNQLATTKMKYGGKMKKGKKCEFGGQVFTEGQSYDIDEITIKQLLEAGYEIDFE